MVIPGLSRRVSGRWLRLHLDTLTPWHPHSWLITIEQGYIYQRGNHQEEKKKQKRNVTQGRDCCCHRVRRRTGEDGDLGWTDRHPDGRTSRYEGRKSLLFDKSHNYSAVWLFDWLEEEWFVYPGFGNFTPIHHTPDSKPWQVTKVTFLLILGCLARWGFSPSLSSLFHCRAEEERHLQKNRKTSRSRSSSFSSPSIITDRRSLSTSRTKAKTNKKKPARREHAWKMHYTSLHLSVHARLSAPKLGLSVKDDIKSQRWSKKYQMQGICLSLSHRLQTPGD